VLWTGKHIKKSQLQAFNPHQKINHFPKTFEITRKDRLFKNVAAMAQQFPDAGFDFLPKTYVLPEEFEKLRKRLHKSDVRWILKPNSSSRGRGIFIIRDLLDISVAAIERCVVCRYIENPLLINGLKFDLRIYVAVTSFVPLRLYIYEEGLARFATGIDVIFYFLFFF
jgi:tubulin polyglutamylase TTLL5